jgi:predicted acyl esterase
LPVISMSVSALLRALLAAATLAGAAVVCLIAPSPAGAWTPEPASYGVSAPTQVMVRMSDGVQLAADIYQPTDPRTGQPAPGRFPVILSQTPYGKRAALTTRSASTDGGPTGQSLGGDGYYPYLVQRGYVNAIVDVRGTGSSGGDFELFGSREMHDGVELVNWAAGLPSSDGRVGLDGSSYLGLNQIYTAALVGPGSPLKAIFPMAAGDDLYRDLTFMGGIPNDEFAAVFAGLRAGMITAQPDQPQDQPTQLATNPVQRAQQYAALDGSLYSEIDTGGPRAYDSDFWTQRAPSAYLGGVVANGVPAFLMGGWFDVYQRGEPLNFAGLQDAWAATQGASAAGRGGPPRARANAPTRSHSGARHLRPHRGRRGPAPAAAPGVAGAPLDPTRPAPMTAAQPVTGRYQLAMGPWFHNAEVLGLALQQLQLRWFDTWLKGEATGMAESRSPLHLFELGPNRWYDTDRYPLARTTVRTLWFGPGTLTDRPPGAAEPVDPLVWTAASSPCNRGTDQWNTGLGTYVSALAGTPAPFCDNNDAGSQAASVTYTSAPLSSPVSVAGPIDVTLYATATSPDSELVANVEDVAPDGSSYPLSSGALLGSMRAVDAARSWQVDGQTVLPWHPYTQASRSAVTPGAIERYDVEVYPTFAQLAAGHRVRVMVSSGTTALAPTPAQLPGLVGGAYALEHSPGAASRVQLPLAAPGALVPSTLDYGSCNGGCRP